MGRRAVAHEAQGLAQDLRTLPPLDAADHQPAVRARAGALLAVGFLGKLVYRKEAMGFGDVELLAMIGAFLGWRGAFLAVFFGSF